MISTAREVIGKMINSLKTIAMFGCTFTSRYRRGLTAAFSRAADMLGVNIVYFNSLGKIGDRDPIYGDHEADIIDFIDLSPYCGVVFDGEGYTIESIKTSIIKKLKNSGLPVVSISSYIEGFYNIEFDDAEGIATLTKHFLDHHHFTKIGYMSGYLTHPDAQVRLKRFREVMRERGLPEDGVGMFEGDFWFHKGRQAAEYFLSLPERPEAIVCANDFMAVSLAKAFNERGIDVPGDIAISGFDGTIEGQECVPHITSATRERFDIASRALGLLLDLSCGREPDLSALRVEPTPIYTHSCGCVPLDYRSEAMNINNAYNDNRQTSYNIYGTESSMLQLKFVDSLEKLDDLFKNFVFKKESIFFGSFNSYFVMLHSDRSGRLSCESDYLVPSGKFVPAAWIDKEEKYVKPDKPFDSTELIPRVNDEKPHSYYIMSVHCAERTFGYCAVEMATYDIFNEFYIVWLLILSMQLETLWKNDRISKLIGTLEDLSIRDGLTGMLNRRGFEELSRDSLRTIEDERTVCTMVIDMDGLKRINDVYGHYEGDRAIKAAANIITKCCDSGEIAGRAGGDEFYIYAPHYSEKKLERFLEKLKLNADNYNESIGKPYKIELSYGALITKANENTRLEDLLRVSDERMYTMKQSKPNRRK
ncbi:MAG: GGDEF domain-containing protein [Ruminococcus sp.]|nr:GGDEF domain-containing protein [Ruminococcus sp.]